MKPYVDLQAYEDPAQGALDFTQELDPAWLIVDTVIGEGEPCSPICGSTELPAALSYQPFMVESAGLSAGPRAPRCIPSLLYHLSALDSHVITPLSSVLEQPPPLAGSTSVAMEFLIKNVKHIVFVNTGVIMPRLWLFSNVGPIQGLQGLPHLALHPTRGLVSLGCPHPLGHQRKVLSREQSFTVSLQIKQPSQLSSDQRSLWKRVATVSLPHHLHTGPGPACLH